MSVARRVEQPVTWPEFVHARILLIDDDPDSACLMARALRRAGCHEILTAGTAADGLRLHLEQSPDLVVLDLNLPGEDGLKLMAQMRGDSPGVHSAPILMVTSDASDKSKLSALEQGVADFLMKSSDTTEFVLRARNLLHLNGLKRQIDRHRELLEETVRIRT